MPEHNAQHAVARASPPALVSSRRSEPVEPTNTPAAKRWSGPVRAYASPMGVGADVGQAGAFSAQAEPLTRTCSAARTWIE